MSQTADTTWAPVRDLAAARTTAAGDPERTHGCVH